MFNLFKKYFVLVLIIVALFAVAMPTFAQDNVIVLPEGTPSLEVAAGSIIAVVYTIISLPFLAPLTTALVAISKRAAFLKRFSGASLNFTWAAILFGAWVFALKLGFGTQFQTGVAAITPILTTLGTYVLGLTMTSIASSKVYEQAKAQKVAVFGYSRPLTMVQAAATAYKPTPVVEFADGDLHG